MTALRSPTQPSRDMTMNSGITPSCTGTAMVAITNSSSPRRPRNRSLEKANPARVAKKTTETEVTTETMTEFHSADQKLMSEPITCWRLDHRLPWGSREGIGVRAMVPASEERAEEHTSEL